MSEFIHVVLTVAVSTVLTQRTNNMVIRDVTSPESSFIVDSIHVAARWIVTFKKHCCWLALGTDYSAFICWLLIGAVGLTDNCLCWSPGKCQ